MRIFIKRESAFSLYENDNDCFHPGIPRVTTTVNGEPWYIPIQFAKSFGIGSTLLQSLATNYFESYLEFPYVLNTANFIIENGWSTNLDIFQIQAVNWLTTKCTNINPAGDYNLYLFYGNPTDYITRNPSNSVWLINLVYPGNNPDADTILTY